MHISCLVLNMESVFSFVSEKTDRYIGKKDDLDTLNIARTADTEDVQGSRNKDFDDDFNHNDSHWNNTGDSEYMDDSAEVKSIMETEEDQEKDETESYGSDEDTKSVSSSAVSVDSIRSGSFCECKVYKKIDYTYSNPHVSKFLQSAFDMETKLPLDADELFCDWSAVVHSKQNFLFKIRNWAAQHNVTMDAILEMFIVFNEFSNGHLKLGLKKTVKNKLVLDLQRYLPSDQREYMVHICPKECSSFFDNSIKCAVCKSWRFTKCKRRGCQHREACNPFIESPGYHGISQRTARNSYYYRSLIILIKELLQWSLMKETDLFAFSKRRHALRIDDVLDGSQAKCFLEKMHSNFMRYARENRPKVLTEVSLLLSDFYDGAVLFDRSSLSVWPLIVEILNCLPPDRCKSGVGQHLIALHHMSHNSLAERQLFSELYIQELHALEKGIEFSLNCNGVEFHFFVQARVIVHRLDTKALEKMAVVQGANSKAGCSLCNTQCGVSRKENRHPFNRVVYFGYRRLLPSTHWLRYCGMSRKCCPVGYYMGNNFDFHALPPVTTDNVKYSLNRKDLQSCEPQSTEVSTGSDTHVNKKMKGDDIHQILFNKEFNMDDFLLHCEPAHCDLRSHLQYKRRPQTYYDEFDESKEPMETMGVRGHSVYSSLEASNVENAMCYDAFHALKNFASDIVKLLIGEDGCERSFIEAMQRECRFTRIDLTAGATKYDWKIPWLLSNIDRDRADAALNCILTPVGMKKKFNAKNALKTPGLLKGDELIQYLCAYLPFSLHVTTLKAHYKNLFSLCAMVCANILSPSFENMHSIDSLFDRTVEMLSLFECMLPDVSQKFSHHELLDIVDGIKKFGPVRCWWTLSGERLMKSIKSCAPSGGINPLKTIHDSFVWKEKTRLHSYKCDQKKWNNRNEFCDNAIKLVGDSLDLSLSNSVANAIMYAVYHCMHISELDDNLEELAKRSPFFMLYSTFRTKWRSRNFIEWLSMIAKSPSEMMVFYPHGEVIYNRVVLLIEELLNWKVITYRTSAVIKGIHFRARGSKWADPNVSNLRKQWNLKEHYSAWCKFLNWNYMSDPMSSDMRYGQLNYFFRITWKNDSLVKNVALASISTRRITTEKKFFRWCSMDSLDMLLSFIPLYVIESTNVAVCGLTTAKVPIIVEATKETNKLKTSRYEQNSQCIDKLYFIDMHPHRSSVQCSFEDSCLLE